MNDKILSMNAIVAGTGSGLHYRVMTDITSLMSIGKQVVLLDIGYSYKQFVQILGKNAVFHEFELVDTTTELALGRLTVFDFEKTFWTPEAIRKNLQQLHDILRMNNFSGHLVIIETYGFKEGYQQLLNLIREHKGDLTIAVYELSTLSDLGININEMDCVSFHPRSIREASDINYPYFADAQQLADEIKSLDVTRGLLIELLHYYKGGTIKRGVISNYSLTC
jgi:hypothetical protein